MMDFCVITHGDGVHTSAQQLRYEKAPVPKCGGLTFAEIQKNGGAVTLFVNIPAVPGAWPLDERQRLAEMKRKGNVIFSDPLLPETAGCAPGLACHNEPGALVLDAPPCGTREARTWRVCTRWTIKGSAPRALGQLEGTRPKPQPDQPPHGGAKADE